MTAVLPHWTLLPDQRTVFSRDMLPSPCRSGMADETPSLIARPFPPLITVEVLWCLGRQVGHFISKNQLCLWTFWSTEELSWQPLSVC